MNKEQAIAALETERLNSSEAVIVVENGAQYFTAPTLYNAGLNKAIEILRSLPDETPTVLTREKLGTMIKELKTRLDPPDDLKYTVNTTLQNFARALLALGPVVVEKDSEFHCDYPTCQFVGGRDVEHSHGSHVSSPVVVEGPVECPFFARYGDHQSQGYWWDGATYRTNTFCPGCGTRLQGGENVTELG